MKRKLVILGLSGLLAGLAACGWALFVRIKPPTLAVQAAFTPMFEGTNLYTGLVTLVRNGAWNVSRLEVFQELWTTNTVGQGGAPSGFHSD